MAWPNIANRCCFMLEKKKKINEYPLHPINSKTFVFVRFTGQAFKPLFFGNTNASTFIAQQVVTCSDSGLGLSS